jgi:glutamyl/glutaminyl-tRNA synthetase
VAVTGSTISPAIYDTLVLLGKVKTLKRIRQCLSQQA